MGFPYHRDGTEHSDVSRISCLTSFHMCNDLSHQILNAHKKSGNGFHS